MFSITGTAQRQRCYQESVPAPLVQAMMLTLRSMVGRFSDRAKKHARVRTIEFYNHLRVLLDTSGAVDRSQRQRCDRRLPGTGRGMV